ncbi:hypothetical protein HBI29_162670 [Parastagonospora nodorum]|nr:hypothetical protein HBI29_162670 [Parastagonospora nodorum]
MSQTNVREGYRITTLEVIELVEDLTSYVKKKDLLEKIQSEKSQSQLLKSLRSLTLKDWLAVAKCIRLRNAQIPKVFYEAAAGTIWTMMLAKVRYNTLTLTLSETAQRRSSSVVSNRSIALITDKFSVASLTEPAILNDANVALVDAVHYSVHLKYDALIQHLLLPKYSDWYQAGTSQVIDALTMTLIKDDDDLLGTVNSYIKLRRLRARCKTEAADSRHAKASGRRTKKDKDLEDSDTGSDVLRLRRRDRAAARARLAERKRLGKEAQLKKTRDEEELAKAKKEKEEKEARDDDYRLDSSSDIDSEDNSEDEEATTAKDLLTDAYILYFKELSSDNGGIFANAMGIGKTRAIVLATEVQNARVEGDATEHNAVNDDDKLCPTKGERTFYCACERSSSFNAEPQQACDPSDLLALQFCFFSDSPPENIGRLTKEEAIEMRIDTTDAISKALAAANKLVALRSYIIPEANTPAVHPKATKHRPALLAAQFVIVCSFGKVDKHVFRAYNTISVTAQRTIIRKGGPYVEKRAILLSGYVTKAWALSGTPMEQGLNEILIFVSLALISLQNRKGGKLISGIKGDFLPYFQSCLCPDFLSTVQNAEQQCRDILEKEGLNKSEASRRVIFNCFEMQAIASYPALATLKAAQFKTYSSRKVKRFTSNSVKDLFTNSSKDHFLVREARAITKSSPKFQNLSNLCSESIAAEDAAKAANTPLLLKEVCAKILIGSYKLIVQAVTWLGLREKFSDESVLVMQGGMTQHEINLKLAKWRDPDGPWIMVASIAFAEAIILTEATHVLAEMCVGIVYFNLDSELELKVLGKQDVKTTS